MANKKLIIEVDMNERWISYFLEMLATMEMLGNIGASRNISFYSDGDGDFRPNFKVNGQNLKNINVTLNSDPIRQNIHYSFDAG